MNLIRPKGGNFELTELGREHLVSSSQWFLGPYYASLKERPVCQDMIKVLRTGKPANFASNKSEKEWAKAMEGEDFARPAYLMGRALGRVLAHELVHVFAKSGAHGREGAAQPVFSGRELIGPPLRLSREDVARLRRSINGN